jgi:hypothetical protein
MRPGESLAVNNPDGSAAYEVTCQKDGTIVYDDFDSSFRAYYRGSLPVFFKGVTTFYVCGGSLAGD